MFKMLSWFDEVKLQSWFDETKLEDMGENPNAVQYLEEHPEKIIWESLSVNPAAIKLLEANQEIHWDTFSVNPSIFQ